MIKLIKEQDELYNVEPLYDLDYKTKNPVYKVFVQANPDKFSIEDITNTSKYYDSKIIDSNGINFTFKFDRLRDAEDFLDDIYENNLIIYGEIYVDEKNRKRVIKNIGEYYYKESDYINCYTYLIKSTMTDSDIWMFSEDKNHLKNTYKNLIYAIEHNDYNKEENMSAFEIEMEKLLDDKYIFTITEDDNIFPYLDEFNNEVYVFNKRNDILCGELLGKYSERF